MDRDQLLDRVRNNLPVYRRIDGRMQRVDMVAAVTAVRASLNLKGENMNAAEALEEGFTHIRGQVDKFAEAQKRRTVELDERSTETAAKVLELQARLLEIEQRGARLPGGGLGGAFDHGGELRATLEGSTELQAMAQGKLKRTVLDLPAGFFKAAITSTGITMPDQRPGIVAPATRRLTIRSLIPSVPTIGGSITYLEETGFTNLAATVSEGDMKPESSLAFTLRTAAVVTLAHWIRATKQVLDDIPQLQMYIDGRMRFGLADVEDVQMLSGSGVGNNLNGLKTAATAYSAPFAAPAPTMIDTLRLMIAQLENAYFNCTGIVLHPNDWARCQLAKDTTNRYIFGDPKGSNMPSMWGIPVVSTTAMTAGTALVGDFQQAALIFDREQARVDISTETDDDFVTNRCHIRAEERLALAILRPGALIKNADLPPTG